MKNYADNKNEAFDRVKMQHYTHLHTTYNECNLLPVGIKSLSGMKSLYP